MTTLDKELTELIARDLGVSVEQVTTEFIMKWREEHLYPRLKAGLQTRYGGYNTIAQRVLTQEEIESQRAEAEAFLKRLSEADFAG